MSAAVTDIKTHRSLGPTVTPVQIPSNTKMSGLFLDREHACLVGKLITEIPNRDVSALLALWQATMQFHPFALIAGELHASDGGTLGGVARDWESAMALFREANRRFDGVAAQGGRDFSTVWFLLLNEDRRAMVSASAAGSQVTKGTA